MCRFTLIVLAFAALLLVGCGPPPVTPVQGTVTFGPKRPADNVLLQFHPLGEVEGRKPLSGSAVTDSAGHFQVKCDDGRDGLPPGEYVVTVIDNTQTAGGHDPKETRMPGGENPKAIPVSRVPGRYTLTDSRNPLRLTVEAGKTTGYDLKLEK